MVPGRSVAGGDAALLSRDAGMCPGTPFGVTAATVELEVFPLSCPTSHLWAIPWLRRIIPNATENQI